ncbi:MAG: ABC transporter ATP-binding protein [Nitriliruptoraceae bacterium]
MSAPAGTVPAVSLRQVTKRFPETRLDDEVVAVDALDLDVADGEFFALLGPSGCGKTTTLRMIAGFEFPTEGSVHIHGEEMGRRTPDRRPVNTVFQSYALFPHMTVAENIAFGLEMRDVPRDEARRRVDEAIGLVQLQGRGGAMPSDLSGGQQQRVALARAIVNRPKVLLLDEPLGALDLRLREAMQVELKQLKAKLGITFVHVTHDQEEALAMSDRLAVMDAGRIVQIGTPAEVYERPRTRFVAEFLGDANLLTAEVLDADRVRLPDGTAARIAADRPAGATVHLSLRPEQLDLVAVDAEVDGHLDTVPGTVARIGYFGSALEYDVALDTGGAEVLVTARLGNARGVVARTVGERVRMRWAPQSVTVLED